MQKTIAMATFMAFFTACFTAFWEAFWDSFARHGADIYAQMVKISLEARQNQATIAPQVGADFIRAAQDEALRKLDQEHK